MKVSTLAFGVWYLNTYFAAKKYWKSQLKLLHIYLTKATDLFWKIFEAMGCFLGPESLRFVEECDNARIRRADHRSSDASKQARIARKEARAVEDEMYDAEEGLMYGPGIAD